MEKCKLLYVLGTGWAGFLMTLVLTVIGLIVFIECYKVVVKTVKPFFYMFVTFLYDDVISVCSGGIKEDLLTGLFM